MRVDAALGDQCVAKARIAALCQYFCPQCSCTLPITSANLDERYIGERFGDARRKLRVTEKLRKHDWYHHHLSIRQRLIEQLSILTRIAFQKGNPSARSGCNHRSAFNSANVRLK